MSDPELVRLVDMGNNEGLRAILQDATRCTTKDLCLALDAAANHGNVDAIQMLIAAGAEVQHFALVHAVSNNHPDALRVLLQHHVPGLADHAFALLSMAVMHGFTKIVRILLEKEEIRPYFADVQRILPA